MTDKQAQSLSGRVRNFPKQYARAVARVQMLEKRAIEWNMPDLIGE